MLYRLLQLRTISVSAVFVIVIARRRRKRNSTFLFFVFIDHRFTRFGRKYYAYLYYFPCRGPAVSLNTSGFARTFTVSLAAVLPYREYEQVSAFFLLDFFPGSAARPTELRINFDSRVSAKSRKAFPYFCLCSAARQTEPRIDLIPVPYFSLLSG